MFGVEREEDIFVQSGVFCLLAAVECACTMLNHAVFIQRFRALVEHRWVALSFSFPCLMHANYRTVTSNHRLCNSSSGCPASMSLTPARTPTEFT